MTAAGTASTECANCGSQVAPSLLSCPSCHTLLHKDLLKSLAAEAQAAEDVAEFTRALEVWRRALTLLPADSPQHATIVARIATLQQHEPARAKAARKAEEERVRSKFSRFKGKAGSALGAVAVLLWKLKFAALFILTKLKLLLLGFTKLGTLLSMLATVGAYWALWGWPFAVGFVLSIYVHEMGHVSALRHYGVRATAPMFIPFVGAFVRLREALHSDWENAIVGLAGPLWGLGASVTSLALYQATAAPVFAGIAHSSAWLNLFNLLPIWQLDGGRGFSAMSRTHRLAAAGAVIAAWAVTHEPMCLLVGLVAAVMAFTQPSRKPDVRIAAYYIGLAWALTGVSVLAMAAGGR